MSKTRKIKTVLTRRDPNSDSEHDFEFTGVLLEPLAEGEDPASKLPALYEALGGDDLKRAVLILATLCPSLPGFKKKRRTRPRAGRPGLLSAVYEAKKWGPPCMPDWLIADKEEKLFIYMGKLSAARTGGRRLTTLQIAKRVLEQQEIEGEWNSFCAEGVSRDIKSQLAKRLESLFKHRKRAKKQHAKARRKFKDKIRIEVEEKFVPHWPHILSEMNKRFELEAVQRVEAGEKLDAVLSDLVPRSIEIAKSIADDLFGGKSR